MTDRELLEMEAKANIGNLAIAEHVQWVTRNEARDALKRKLRDCGLSRQELSAEDWDWEPVDWAEWQALLSAEKKAQMKLDTLRAAARRAIVSAVAEIDKAMP